MIHVFNAPIDPISMVEVYKAPEGSDELYPPEEQPRRRPKLTYTPDGRRMINGELETPNSPVTMWSAALVHQTARRWRKRALSTTSVDSRFVDMVDSNTSTEEVPKKSYSISSWIGGWLTNNTLWWSAFGALALLFIYKKYSGRPQIMSAKAIKW
uniref:Uncharacterized protein n=1 Tax=Plectus sambesii TaxID=2011161 RepID=A0A914W7I5_9BILA